MRVRESHTAVVARNDTWSGHAASEPYEAGWAVEAVIFVRPLGQPHGPQPAAHVELSPDGIHWAAEGTTFQLPETQDTVAFARVRHFGNWLRITADFEDGASSTVLVTLHLKA